MSLLFKTFFCNWDIELNLDCGTIKNVCSIKVDGISNVLEYKKGLRVGMGTNSNFN